MGVIKACFKNLNHTKKCLANLFKLAYHLYFRSFLKNIVFISFCRGDPMGRPHNVKPYEIYILEFPYPKTAKV